MFFMFSINDKFDEIYTDESVRVCKACGRYGRYSLLMKYRNYALFFLPVHKSNKEYYVKANCCDSIFSIDQSAAEDIASGEKSRIDDSDINLIDYGYGAYGDDIKTCNSCGYETSEDFLYCPKCGEKL